MEFDAVPAGTAPDQAIVMRGADPAVHVPSNSLLQQTLGDALGTTPGQIANTHTGEKLAIVADDAGYDPRNDTCVKAFVRLLAARAEAEHAAEPAGEPEEGG